MNNKVGFTPEQQRELSNLIEIAIRAARVLTEVRIGENEASAMEMLRLLNFIRDTYPHGPMHLKESLDNIIRFCDLDGILIARGPDAPDPRP
jgi:hypothetical protein